MEAKSFLEEKMVSDFEQIFSKTDEIEIETYVIINIFKIR